MTDRTVLGLLRHGQTDWNIDFRLQGVTDIPMNETGIAQARAAAMRINRADWDVILTSPLSRARQTAEIVAEIAGFEKTALEIEPLLLERSFGKAEGMTHAEWKNNFGETLADGAESLKDLEIRTGLLLETLATTYAGARVLAVSHGALIRQVLSSVSFGALPPAGERISNACLNRFAHTAEQGWHLVEYAPQPLS